MLSVSGGLRLRAIGRRLAGLWVASGAGDVLDRAHGEKQSISLHKGDEILFETIRWKACLRSVVQAGVVENIEGAIWEVTVVRHAIPGKMAQKQKKNKKTSPKKFGPVFCHGMCRHKHTTKSKVQLRYF